METMRQGLEEKPRLVFWETTQKCNLRCVHCRASATGFSSPADLRTNDGLAVIKQISEYASPILVLSGGEPLYRADIFDLASYATQHGLRVALATNGTLVSKPVAHKIVDSGVRRVAISLDGADAATHDGFRGIPGSFNAALDGFRNLRELGMSLQINTTIARHNAHQLPQVLELAKSLGADALHTFLLVPVGCGVDIAEDQMVPAPEYEKILNWFYDRAQEGEIEMKATCAPHYFRVVRQRRAAERQSGGWSSNVSAPTEGGNGHGPSTLSFPRQRESTDIGAAEIAMPGSTSISLRPGGNGHAAGSPAPMPAAAAPKHGGHPGGMNAITRGCLAGSGVCFISFQGEVFPCGYLPVMAGDLRRQSFAEVWEASPVFQELRNTGNLKGKCGCCEFRNVCMGCRARAYAATGDYMQEEPFCVYQPGAGNPVVRQSSTV
jgi:radical SAM protein with 4Fe4S-binding SPASM domain